jgi:hypothetical protein
MKSLMAPKRKNLPRVIEAIPDALHPFITGKATFAEFDDGHVFGRLSFTGSEVTIHEWESATPGVGHTRTALKWLREKFATITACGVGEADEDGVWDIATCYWIHMRKLGLVDRLLDDHGADVPLDACSSTPKHQPLR